MKIKTYAQYKGAIGKLSALIGTEMDHTTVDRINNLSDSEKAQLRQLSSDLNPITDADVKRMKAEHYDKKRKAQALQTKQSQPTKASTSSSTKQKRNQKMKNTISAKARDNHLRGKALLNADATVAINKELQRKVVEKARLVGGLFGDVNIEVADSNIIKANPVALSAAQVQAYQETDGTNGFIRSQTGTGVLVQPTVYTGKNEFKEYISKDLVNDSHTDIEEWLLSQASRSFTNEFAIQFVAGDETTNKEFMGIFGNRFDATNSFEADDSRNIELLGAFESKVDGSLGLADPAVAGSAVENIRDFIDTLPTEHREGAKFYMHKTTFSAIRKLKTLEGSALVVGGKIDEFDVVLDDMMPSYDPVGAVAEPLMAFGKVNEALAVKAHPSNLEINPYKIDGAIAYEEVQRMSCFIKDNDALRIFYAGSKTP